MASKGMVAVPLAPHVYIGTKRYHMHNFALAPNFQTKKPSQFGRYTCTFLGVRVYTEKHRSYLRDTVPNKTDQYFVFYCVFKMLNLVA